MKIELTHQESEEYFHNALCNGLDWIGNYGLEIKDETPDYKAAKERLSSKNPTEGLCYEDVLMEVLNGGGKLTIEDVESGDGETWSITLNDVHERVSKTPVNHLMDMINETDDATTADVILQTVFFQEIVYG